MAYKSYQQKLISVAIPEGYEGMHLDFKELARRLQQPLGKVIAEAVAEKHHILIGQIIVERTLGERPAAETETR